MQGRGEERWLSSLTLPLKVLGRGNASTKRRETWRVIIRANREGKISLCVTLSLFIAKCELPEAGIVPITKGLNALVGLI